MQVNYLPFVNGIMIPDYEGGYCWDRGDAGGPTNWGITCYDLAEHRHQKMTSMAAWAPLVKAMPESEADDIYATKYKGDFDALPAGPDVAEFDYKVNSGIGRVAVVRPRILALAGKRTVQDCDPKWYVDAICQERQEFLNGLGRRMPQFLHGWTARVTNLRGYCERLAANTVTIKVPVPPTVKAAPKATHTDPNLGTHTGSGVAAGGGAVVTAVHQGFPLMPAIALGVAGGAAFLLWAAWRAHQNEVLNTTVILPKTIPPHP